MKKSLITNTHGFTSEALRKEERAISDAFFRQRVTAVRLILEGFSTVKAAEVLGICRQSVSTYVKMFNRGGIAELLQRNFPPGKQPYLSPEEQMEVKKVILESTPEQEGIEPSQSWDTRLLQKWIELHKTRPMSSPSGYMVSERRTEADSNIRSSRSGDFIRNRRYANRRHILYNGRFL
ncbi:helix-turn-helix domain-containing protein [Aneurinibacillus thermoaerophilus]|uniref:helix-turn-helix domain-containing protein n=2 Tax=Aneurinibacillus thermoaerophilus TaxID=143495 RepID=UPI002E1AEB6C|nr:helix-turn-helix domain-containing protein [Aneurinibacillus thermoaerophilus]